MEVFDNEVVPSSLQYDIAPILRVAAEIQNERPRVAYLCTSHPLFTSLEYFCWFYTYDLIVRGSLHVVLQYSLKIKIIHGRENAHELLYILLHLILKILSIAIDDEESMT